MEKIWWCEPRWHYVPKQIRGFRTILPLKRLRLCFLVFGLITIVIALAMKIWLPNLQFDWLKAFVTSIAAFLGMMLLHLVVHNVVPPIVSIDRHGVRYSHGQTGMIFKHEDIFQVRLSFFSGGRIRMRIRTDNDRGRVS